VPDQPTSAIGASEKKLLEDGMAGIAEENLPFLFLEAHAVPKKASLDIQNSILLREIFRQSLLIAARDGLGLTTRDAALGEIAPDGLGKRGQLGANASIQVRKTTRLEVWSAALGASKPIYVVDTQLKGRQRLLELLQQSEAASRTTMVDALHLLKLKGQTVLPPSTEEIPDDVETLLNEMTYTAQFQAVRWLHALIKAKGESPALLGGLVRGYANLGVLTEFHWDTGPKVFKARALLYAQRLIANLPDKSAFALWHRGYAMALVGDHRQALQDVAIADGSAEADTSPVGKEGKSKKPEWVGLIEAYCKFDTAKLNEAVGTGKYSQWAQLLSFLTVENARFPSVTLAAGGALLQNNPECYRVHDSLSGMGGVRSQHVTTLLGIQVFDEKFLKRLAGIYDLPESARKLLGEDDKEPEFNRALIDAGRSPKDTSELSWTAFGRLALETRFAQFCRRLDFMERQWGVPTQDFAGEALILVADHPLAPFVRSYTMDRARDTATLRALMQNLPLTGYESCHTILLRTYKTVDDAKFTEALNLNVTCRDETYNDYAALFGDSFLAPTASYAGTLSLLSPHSPLANSALVRFEWNVVQMKAADLEKEARHPSVLFALGEHYLSAKQYAEAERCLKRCLEVSPDLDVFLKLAEAYKAQQKLDQWQATLEAFLKESDPGLGHARVQAQIAEHWMSRKDFEKALPFAESAAETWAAWAMLCAHRCNEALENWDKAELYVRRTSERYDNLYEHWYYWCIRTGKGDLKEAEKFMGEYFESIAARASAVDLTRAIVLCVASKQKDKALRHINTYYERFPKTSLITMMLVLAMDDAGDTTGRDRLLQEFPGGPKAGFKLLAEKFREALAKGEKAELDQEYIKAMLGVMENKERAITNLMVGLFVEQHGDSKSAVQYYAGALGDSAHMIQDLAMLATARLRALGAEVPKVQAGK
jgi:tetratricopeptide (TPR) repeat protein